VHHGPRGQAAGRRGTGGTWAVTFWGFNMKWMFTCTLVLLLSGCGFYNYEVVEYRRVMTTPTVQTITVYDEEPIDVTTTMIEYY